MAIAFGLALGPAVALGLARFGYSLLLPSMRTDLHWSFAVAGVMNTANAVGYLLGALLTAPLTRRWGVRRVFALSTMLTAFSLLTTAASGSTPVIAVVRAAAGVFGAVSFVAGAALVAGISSGGSPRRAASMLSIYTAGAGAGMVISGAAIPLLLTTMPARTGWRWGWVLLAALAVLAIVVVLPTARSCHEPPVAPQGHDKWLVRRLTALIACYGLFGAGYIAYMTFIVAYLKGRGADAGLITAFWIVLGASAIASSFAWVPAIARLRAGGAPSLMLATTGAGALLPILSRSSAATMGSAVLFGGSFLALAATVMAVARRSLRAHHWTSAIAALTAAFAVGQCLGPVLAGALSDGSAGLEAGLCLSAGILAAGSLVALAQRHHEADPASFPVPPGDSPEWQPVPAPREAEQ